MKHLPNELLYLLKVYNYIMYEIGLDRARSHADEIRAYIAKADFLDGYPTVKEYLSEDKSIDDIITYIQRNEKTYSLLGDWKNGEITALLSSKGIEGTIGIVGGFSVKKEGDNAYFLLPGSPCYSNKIVLLNADLNDDANIEKILWLEFYKTREGMCLEIFDDNCDTVKISFSDFEIEKVFHSVANLSECSKAPYDLAVKMAAAIFEKHEYDSTLLNEDENRLFPIVSFFAEIKREGLHGAYPEMNNLFSEYKIDKGQKILSKTALLTDEKKLASLSRKMARLLKSKKCAPLIDRINNDIIASQNNI